MEKTIEYYNHLPYKELTEVLSGIYKARVPKQRITEGTKFMNIQIFGTKKSSDTRKAERFFKERGIRFQSIDLKEKGLSKGEFNSVLQAVGGVDAMIDPDCKDKDLLALVTYISADEREEKVMENQSVIRQPIVRNGRQATVGYAPDVWKTWQ